MSSPKPKIIGILAAIQALLGLVAIPLLDGNPATNPDWGMAMTVVTQCVALLFVRQNDVTSEDVGAK